METGQELRLGKYKAIFELDDTCDSPIDNDTLGTMVTWHRNYDIGHITNPDYPKGNFKSVLMSDRLGYEESDYPYWTTEEEYQELDRLVKELYILKNLYIHDHGSVYLSTTPFSDPWDSGHLGFIYVDKKAVHEMYHLDSQLSFNFMDVHFEDNASRLRSDETKFLLAAEQLDLEVSLYNKWSQGDTWIYLVYEIDADPSAAESEYVESCGNLIGEDEALESATDMLKCLNEK
jgi:hypothetical protein